MQNGARVNAASRRSGSARKIRATHDRARVDAILIIEPGKRWAVEIQHSQQPPMLNHILAGQCSAQIGVARVSFAVPVVASEKMPEITPGSTNTSPGAAKMNASAQCHPHTVMAPKNAPTVIGNVNRRNTAANTAARAQTGPMPCSIPVYPAAICAEEKTRNAVSASMPIASFILAPDGPRLYCRSAKSCATEISIHRQESAGITIV